MIFLSLALAILLLGPLLYYFGAWHSTLYRVVNLITTLSVVGLILFLVLPHLYEDNGWIVLLPAFVGFLGPFLLELRIHAHHKLHKAMLILVLVGLGVHAFLDGIALNLTSRIGTAAFPTALVLHRAADGLAVWKLLQYDPWKAWSALGAMAFVTAMGFSAGDIIAADPHSANLAYFEAFIAGTLLHVLTHTQCD